MAENRKKSQKNAIITETSKYKVGLAEILELDLYAMKHRRLNGPLCRGLVLIILFLLLLFRAI